MTREELVSRISRGGRAFRALSFIGEDLSNLDLSNCDFRRCSFVDTLFTNSNLTNCIMVLCDIKGAQFEGAILDSVNWELVKNAGLANMVGGLYKGSPIKQPAIADKVGKYQRLVTDRFIQIGCLKGDETYWKTMDDAKLDAEVEKVNPSEKEDARAWKAAHLSKTILDHENSKKK